MDSVTRTPISISAWAAAALSAVIAGIAIADQVALGWTQHDVSAHYGPFGLTPDPQILTTFLTVAALGATATFVVIALLARRGRRPLAIVTAGLALVVGVAVASLTTFAYEYQGHVFTSFWRYTPWLLPIAAGGVCALLVARLR